MPDEVWSAFSTAGFTYWARAAPQSGRRARAATSPIFVRPAPPGTVSGRFPFGEPVAFVTADNPHGRAATEVENARRRADLADALDDLDRPWLPAVGGGPDGDHQEPGAVVLGLDAPAAARLGARFDQAAVYVWEPTALHLVACAGDRHDVLGYATTACGSAPPPPRLRPE